MERYQFPKIKNEILFEDFSRDFVNLLYPDTNFQLYGRKGQSQSGIDGYSTSDNIYFQSKHKSKDNIKDKDIINELINEFARAKPKIQILSEYEKSKYLYITTYNQSTLIQDHTKTITSNKITVEYWGWEDIESSLNDFFKKENIDFFFKYYSDIAKNLEVNIVPRQLSIKSVDHLNIFIGRKEEIESIDTSLNKNKILLINGIGGIGKSSTVNQYLYIKKEEYSHFGIFEDLSGFISDLKYTLNLKSDRDEYILKEVIVKLRKLNGNKLFIIDNVSNIEKNLDTINIILALREYGFHILLTSRELIENIPNFELNTMNNNDAKDLFNSIYKTEDSLVERILFYLDNHTFFIEKTAKTLKSKDSLTPKKIIEYFESGKFPKIKMTRKESFENLLDQLFSIDDLDDLEIETLKELTIFPSEYISFIDLKFILQKKDHEEFEDILNYLSEKGWLTSYDDGTNIGYKLHQINKEFFFSSNKPDLKNFIGPIKLYTIMLNNSVDIEVSLSNKFRIIYFESLYKTLKTLNILSKEVFTLYEKISNVYLHLGKIDLCFELINYALNIKEKIKDINDLSFMNVLNLLSQLYMRKGDYKNSLNNNLKVLNITKNYPENDSIDLSTIYSNLAICYRSLGEYNNSFTYFDKALLILKNKKENVNFSFVYKGLAELYQLINEHKKALSFFKKTLSNRKKFLKDNHPHIAQSYNDLGFIYAKMNKRTIAIQFYLEAIRRQEEILGKNHIDLASSYNNIGESYRILNQFSKAYFYISKGVRIREKELGEKALDTAMSYNTLGVYYIDTEDFNKAIEYLNKALNTLNIILGHTHNYSLATRENIEYAYSLMNKKLNKVNNVKIERNSSCPCGSGKKYKKCCG